MVVKPCQSITHKGKIYTAGAVLPDDYCPPVVEEVNMMQVGHMIPDEDSEPSEAQSLNIDAELEGDEEDSSECTDGSFPTPKKIKHRRK